MPEYSERDWPQAYAWRDCSKCENLFCKNSGEDEEKNKFAYCDHYREGRIMRDFNTVKSDLIQHLKLSCQKTDGEILWYAGTLDVLVEFLSILRQKAEEGE